MDPKSWPGATDPSQPSTAHGRSARLAQLATRPTVRVSYMSCSSRERRARGRRARASPEPILVICQQLQPLHLVQAGIGMHRGDGLGNRHSAVRVYENVRRTASPTHVIQPLHTASWPCIRSIHHDARGASHRIRFRGFAPGGAVLAHLQVLEECASRTRRELRRVEHLVLDGPPGTRQLSRRVAR